MQVADLSTDVADLSKYHQIFLRNVSVSCVNVFIRNTLSLLFERMCWTC